MWWFSLNYSRLFRWMRTFHTFLYFNRSCSWEVQLPFIFLKFDIVLYGLLDSTFVITFIFNAWLSWRFFWFLNFDSSYFLNFFLMRWSMGTFSFSMFWRFFGRRLYFILCFIRSDRGHLFLHVASLSFHFSYFFSVFILLLFEFIFYFFFFVILFVFIELCVTETFIWLLLCFLLLKTKKRMIEIIIVF